MLITYSWCFQIENFIFIGFCPFSVLLAIHGGPWLTHDKERHLCSV